MGNKNNKRALPLSLGDHILRISFANGEFNLGRMTFAFLHRLTTISRLLIQVIILLSCYRNSHYIRSGSYDPGNNPFVLSMDSSFGPSQITFSDDLIAEPDIFHF
ncbi:MAG: hypothetical protein R2764_01915 [Bacteroidales bacterium]